MRPVRRSSKRNLMRRAGSEVAAVNASMLTGLWRSLSVASSQSSLGSESLSPTGDRSQRSACLLDIINLGDDSCLLRVWPAERVLMGLRVCKWLRSALQCAPEVVVHVRARALLAGAPRQRGEGFLSWLWGSAAKEEAGGLQVLQHLGKAGAVQVLLDGDGAVAAAGQHLLRKLVLGLGDARVRLSRLVLRRVDLGDAGAGALAEVLAGCALLSELDVAEDKIGAAGAAALCAVLPAASRLAALDLSHNRFGPAGALALAAALPRCAALGELRIGGVRTGEEGARALAAALSQVPNGLRLLAIPCTGTGAQPAVPPRPCPPCRAAPRAAATRVPF
jgi:hypothetical protein